MEETQKMAAVLLTEHETDCLCRLISINMNMIAGASESASPEARIDMVRSLIVLKSVQEKFLGSLETFAR